MAKQRLVDDCYRRCSAARGRDSKERTEAACERCEHQTSAHLNSDSTPDANVHGESDCEQFKSDTKQVRCCVVGEGRGRVASGARGQARRCTVEFCSFAYITLLLLLTSCAHTTYALSLPPPSPTPASLNKALDDSTSPPRSNSSPRRHLTPQRSPPRSISLTAHTCGPTACNRFMRTQCPPSLT